MTELNEVTSELLARGFRSYPTGLAGLAGGPDGAVWAGERPLPDVAPCESNGRTYMHAIVWDMVVTLPSEPYRRVALEIRGELHNRWYQLHCYSLGWDDLVLLSAAEADLIAAWQAIAERKGS